MVFNLYELNVMKPTKNFYFMCLHVKPQVYEYVIDIPTYM